MFPVGRTQTALQAGWLCCLTTRPFFLCVDLCVCVCVLTSCNMHHCTTVYWTTFPLAVSCNGFRKHTTQVMCGCRSHSRMKQSRIMSFVFAVLQWRSPSYSSVFSLILEHLSSSDFVYFVFLVHVCSDEQHCTVDLNCSSGETWRRIEDLWRPGRG